MPSMWSKIDFPHIDDSHQHKMVRQFGDFLIETNNLLVKPLAFGSALSAEN